MWNEDHDDMNKAICWLIEKKVFSIKESNKDDCVSEESS